MDVKITYNLARWAVSQRSHNGKKGKYLTNTAIKLVDTWCRLKAHAGYSGVIGNVFDGTAEAMAECGHRTLCARLDEMQRLGWLTNDRGRVVMVGWKRLHHLLGMGFKPDFYQKPPKVADEKTSHYWIYCAEIKENRDTQAYMVGRKVAENHAVKAQLYNDLIQAGADIDRCEGDDLYLCSGLLKLYVDGFVHGGSESYHLLTAIRPDVNRGILRLGMVYNGDADGLDARKLPEAERLRYAMQGARIKRKLVQERLATVQPGGTMESSCRMRNKHCHVGYNHGKSAKSRRHAAYSTFTRLCDDTVPRLAAAAPAVMANKGALGGATHAA